MEQRYSNEKLQGVVDGGEVTERVVRLRSVIEHPFKCDDCMDRYTIARTLSGEWGVGLNVWFGEVIPCMSVRALEYAPQVSVPVYW